MQGPRSERTRSLAVTPGNRSRGGLLRRAAQLVLFCECGSTDLRGGGLCRRCYGARLRSRYRFGGNHDCELLITLCARCHARLHRLAALRRWVPRPLAELWPEVHPGIAVQLQFPLEETA